MKLQLMILVLALGILTGCTTTLTQPEPVIVYRTKVKEVKVPVYPVIPEVKCDFKGTGFEPTVKLLECVINQKRVLDALRSKYSK